MNQPETGPPAEAQLNGDPFQDLLNAVPDAVVVSAYDGTILFYNRQAEIVFGYAADELLGESIDLLVPVRFRGGHVQHRAGYVAAPRVRPMGIGLDLYGLRKDGSEVPVEISLSPASYRGEPAVITSVRDVSACRQLENERAGALTQLEAIQRVTDTAQSPPFGSRAANYGKRRALPARWRFSRGSLRSRPRRPACGDKWKRFST